MAPRAFKMPADVCRAVSAKLDAILSYWSGIAVDSNTVECAWARLPGKLLRNIFVHLCPASLASLLATGSKALMRAALCANGDLVTDALWWHLWNLPDGRHSHDQADACFLNASRAHAVRWLYGDVSGSDSRSRYAVAVDDRHPLGLLPADIETVTRNPNGVAALALSAAGLCGDRVCARCFSAWHPGRVHAPR
ncbi:hypothetical protein pneo_cds_1014 [Pandoravirus neocaledonia]|uniref:Uncharacterized protein n=1 Tax=Pandoravirus neocaledonia TaxID=2107708 RepID=A0A2U7UDT2_9VIRU|nr:hypothetical protein pneo_cds_1014 [Pandoravirus neocaledonia]AVK76621.1 hypothetical protein pneo_cds_1014 [Pandoravirus neocaledonia]